MPTVTPNASFPDEVRRAFGPKRCALIDDALDSLFKLKPAIPDASRFAYVRPYATANADELRRREAAREGRGWWWIKLPLEDGRVVWMTTNLVRSASDRLGPLTVALIDLHPRMAAWALTARWRAEELARETVDSLEAWRIVTAATTARALLEGVLAFCGEARTLESAWSKMKASGPPEPADVLDFRDLLDDPASQAQLASRHYPDEESRDYEIQETFYRKNVLTLMTRGAKLAGLEQKLVDDLYETLSDTAHPSAGSDQAYMTEQEIDASEAQIRWEIGRGPGAVPVPPAGAKPEEAIAAARAVCLALETFAVAWPRFIRVVDDFGLTTEVSFRTNLQYWRRHGRPSPNEPCPCGSGRKWKKCQHEWGVPYEVVATQRLANQPPRT
jgi:hypothetical protein